MGRRHSTDLSKEYFFEEGCFITEIMNDPSMPQQSIARARLPAGQTTKSHLLKETTETYYILSGRGIATIDGISHELTIGDTLFINAEESQSIKNTGTDDLIFLCICQPRFVPSNYVEIEESEK